MPVVQARRKNVLRNLSQSGQRRGHRAWTIVVRFCHRQQDHIEPCRPADRICIVSSVGIYIYVCVSCSSRLLARLNELGLSLTCYSHWANVEDFYFSLALH